VRRPAPGNVVTLGDGARIRIRSIEPGDRRTLEAGFERLGAESRYRRFFAPVSRLSEAQLTYLTDVDHHNHEALIALEEESGDGVGVARFVRIGGDVAEAAVVVVDDWQHRGVGAVLLDALADRAREEGIHTFAATVLASNTTAIAALSRLGVTETSRSGSEVDLSIALEGSRGAVPSLHRLLRHAAERTLHPSVSFWRRPEGSRSLPAGRRARSQGGNNGEPDSR